LHIPRLSALSVGAARNFLTAQVACSLLLG
jgi:hypothetical protein